ncbi:MAG: radical SAM protein [Selenomonadaceae bacterium]|nr:radical SAM protein [Selenomonadaceae bacterium]
MTGDIMSVSRLRMGTDGKGISTLVAFFGCHLHCRYCINEHCHEKRNSSLFMDKVPRGAFSPEELLKILKKDSIYYLMTEGGVTFGGGEPLIQAEFIKKICQKGNPEWNYRIETSLYDRWTNIETLIPFIDEWIIDIKDTNSDIYKAYTGRANARVFQHLEGLLKRVESEKILIRLPLIKGFNTVDDVEKSENMLKSMGVRRIEKFIYCTDIS